MAEGVDGLLGRANVGERTGRGRQVAEPIVTLNAAMACSLARSTGTASGWTVSEAASTRLAR